MYNSYPLPSTTNPEIEDMSRVTQKAEKNQKPTQADIAFDLNNGDWDALYFATDNQISALIDRGLIEEDFFSRHQDYQEEMRIMTAEFE
jgi:hypothetical protein